MPPGPSGDCQETSIAPVLSPKGLRLFSQHQQSCGFRQRLLLAPQLLLELLDLPLILGAELLQFLLLLRLGKLAGLRLHGQNRLLIGILRGLPPTLHLLGVEALLTAIGAELGGVEPSGLQHHRELVSSAPPSGSFSDTGTTSPCSRLVFLHL